MRRGKVILRFEQPEEGPWFPTHSAKGREMDGARRVFLESELFIPGRNSRGEWGY
jgi:hypothetical protein